MAKIVCETFVLVSMKNFVQIQAITTEYNHESNFQSGSCRHLEFTSLTIFWIRYVPVKFHKSTSTGG